MKSFVKYFVLFVCVATTLLKAEAIQAQTNFRNQMEIALGKANPNEAIPYLLQATTLSPDNFFPYYLLGTIYAGNKNNEATIEYHSKALALISPSQMQNQVIAATGSAEYSYRKVVTTIYEQLSEAYMQYDLNLAKEYCQMNISLNIDYNYKAPVYTAVQQLYQIYVAQNQRTVGINYFERLLGTLERRDGSQSWDMVKALLYASVGDFYYYANQNENMVNAYKNAARLGHAGARDFCKNNGYQY